MCNNCFSTIKPVIALLATLLAGSHILAQSTGTVDTKEYYDKLVVDLQNRYQTPGTGTFLIGGDENLIVGEPTAHSYSPTGTMSASFGQDVSGEPFKKAIAIIQSANGIIEFPRHDYQDQVYIEASPSVYHSGEHLLLTFWVRGEDFQSGDEGIIFACVQDKNSGNILASRQVVVKNNWQQFLIPVSTTSDGNGIRTIFQTAYQHQKIEIGGIALIDYGIASLGPVDLVNLGYNFDTYIGKGAVDDPQVNKDIIASRKVNVSVRVLGPDGKPVSGASVKFSQKKHDFLFGGDGECWGLLTPEGDTGFWTQAHILDVHMDGKREGYGTNPPQTSITEDPTPNDTWSTVIDQSVNLSEKHAGWETNDMKTDKLDKAITWYQDHGLDIYLAHLAWGNAEAIPEEKYKNLPSIEKRIDNLTRHLSGKISAYNVLNESYNRTDWESTFNTNPDFGKEASAQVLSDSDYDAWITEISKLFTIAHSNDPSAKLFLSDNNTLENGGLNENRIQYYLRMIKALQAKGTPIYGFAFQAHFGNDQQNYLTDIPRVLSIINRFTSLGIKVRCSEFDFFNNCTDQQRVAYLRDFVSICFSNPNMDSFTFWDPGYQEWQKGAAVLYSSNDKLKPTGTAWANLIYGKFWTDDTRPPYNPDSQSGYDHSGALPTDIEGVSQGRIFKGDYDILIEYGGHSQVYSQKHITSDLVLVLSSDGKVSQSSALTAP